LDLQLLFETLFDLVNVLANTNLWRTAIWCS